MDVTFQMQLFCIIWNYETPDIGKTLMKGLTWNLLDNPTCYYHEYFLISKWHNWVHHPS
jgi:hypothetical protein